MQRLLNCDKNSRELCISIDIYGVSMYYLIVIFLRRKNMEGTFWAFVPAIIAIVLALITKQVYVSLFIGIFVGAMFIADGNPLVAFSRLFESMAEELGGGAWILVFLVMLGIMVILMTRAGGSRAYGNWAASRIKSRKGALLATAGLGALIFVDDYFNCLTVGSVMRPVTDKYRISRAKLSYVIDATAAPICIIAPISSWAAAVSGEVDGNGLIMFIKTIPFNLYALLTIAMVIFLCASRLDFFKMRKNEMNAIKNNDLLSGATELPAEDVGDMKISNRGRVFDLVIPVAILIVTCIGSMIFTGYYFNYDKNIIDMGTVQATNVIEAFGNCNAGLSLAIGSTISVILTALLYLPRKIISFKEFTDSFVAGFKSMVPAILILIFAWTLSNITSALGVEEYIKRVLNPESMVYAIIPAVFFIIAAGMSFATGTSWGTFGILIPLTTAVMGTSQDSVILVVAVSAVLAGSVFGDHVSPISDTTILASSGAQCNHIDHVNTQMPYAAIIAVIAFVSYIASGFIAVASLPYWATALLTLVIGFALLSGFMAFKYIRARKKDELLPDLKSSDFAVKDENAPNE